MASSTNEMTVDPFLQSLSALKKILTPRSLEDNNTRTPQPSDRPAASTPTNQTTFWRSVTTPRSEPTQRLGANALLVVEERKIHLREVARLERQVQQLTGELQQEKQRATQERTLRQSLNKAFDELSAHQKDLTAQMENIEVSRESLRQQIQNLTESLDQQKASAERVSKDKDEEIRKACQGKEEALKERDTIEARLLASQRLSEELNAKIKHYEKERQETKDSHDKVVQSLNNVIQGLQDSLDKSKMAQETLSKELASVKRQLELTEETLKQATEVGEEESERLHVLEANFESLQKETDRLRQELGHSSQTSKANAVLLGQMETNLAEMTSHQEAAIEMEENQAGVEALQQDTERLRHELAQSTKTTDANSLLIQQLESELSEMPSTSATEIGQLQQDTERLRQEIAQSTITTDTNSLLIQQLESKLSEMPSTSATEIVQQLKAKDALLAKKEELINVLKRKVDRLEAERTSLGEQLQQVQDTNEGLESSLRSTKEALDETREELNLAEEEVARSRSVIKELEAGVSAERGHDDDGDAGEGDEVVDRSHTFDRNTALPITASIVSQKRELEAEEAKNEEENEESVDSPHSKKQRAAEECEVIDDQDEDIVLV